VPRAPVAVVGASGYTGAELLRLLAGHPHVEIADLSAQRAAGATVGEVFGHLRGLPIGERVVDAFDAVRISNTAEIAFTALPHGHSARAVAALRARGVAVVDLSADFRLRDPAEYARWYGGPEATPHPAPELLAEAVYGVPERYRDAIAAASLVAGPGCYPTAAILAAAPLLAAGLIRADGLIVDAKSGASGAGRSPGLATHLPEAGEGVRAYKVAGAHRHTAEIEQELGAAAGASVRLVFTPHLLPMSRGILCCVYAAPGDALSALRTEARGRAVADALAAAYDGEPFVTALPAGACPDTAHVRRSNRAHVSATYDARADRVLAMSAIDNLVKGAAGQAIQCMNAMRGWDERAGLDAPPAFP
jgi:N-acetyl-gamma-glutamyl-phosphate reductase